MKLYPPLKQTALGTPRSVDSLISLKTQGFGENPAMYAPLGLKGHNGLDWACQVGTPIYASHEGTVSNQIDSMSGHGVVITTSTHKTIFWHLSEFKCKNGDRVKAGDLIGLSGNTGFSTGPHLHYGLKVFDTNGNVLNRDNGYDGSIDPTQYLVWYDQATIMTEGEVKDVYRLAFYRLPDAGELAYWTGKSLSDFLKTAIKDRAAFLSQ